MNHSVYIVSTSVHILAAVIWVGGLLFMSLMLVPALRSLGNPALMARLIQAVGRRFRYIGWTCLVILLVTGFINLAARGISHEMLLSRDFWGSGFGEILAVKLWMYGAIILLNVIHEITAGERLIRLRETDPAKAEGCRKFVSWLGRITALLSVAIIILAVMLVRGRPF